jgi:ferric-chelate reductase
MCLMLHLLSTAFYSRVYVYVPIGLYLFERLLRTLRYAYNNIRPGRATLVQLPGGVTKIVVSKRQVKSWSPGSFVLLCLLRFGLGQSHPATIASTPNSHGGKLCFLNESTSRLNFSCSRQCQRCLTAGSFTGTPTTNSTLGNIVPGINRWTVRR